MPVKPLRPCNKAGCRNLTRDRYCNEHAHLIAQQNKDRYKYYDKYKRDKDAAAFYNSKPWELVREQALLRDLGLCLHCLESKEITLADMVDHIIPIKIEWDLRLSIGNLQSLCNACHAVKTSEDKIKYR
ncbi:HNH endonuclease [Bacillus sp. OK048]|uniref:HNH endonuclease n=1 Tax=Bacillus sp. OK048 TaxID=1882761 RepID=UPI000B880EFE|nr:HNH endonuclease signature motif containing protein [Bacillus sp. OK048]